MQANCKLDLSGGTSDLPSAIYEFRNETRKYELVVGLADDEWYRIYFLPMCNSFLLVLKF